MALKSLSHKPNIYGTIREVLGSVLISWKYSDYSPLGFLLKHLLDIIPDMN